MNSQTNLTGNNKDSSKAEDIFEIAAKAEKLLKEILSSNKSNNSLLNSVVKQEPIVQPPPVITPPSVVQPQPQLQNVQYTYQQTNAYQTYPPMVYHSPGPGPGLSYYVNHPPPPPAPTAYYTPVYYQTAYPTLARPAVSYHQYQQTPQQHYSNQQFVHKRKFNDINNNNNNNESNDLANCDAEEDLNIIRERELKDLKCKSVLEKMNVFLKYYKQFKDAYIQRVQTLECPDSLKLQFNSLIKYLNEYDSVLNELNLIIIEHEREYTCKNNHRKTKKFFNKSKAFIRYECSKRLQSNIFEYRRLINSQDRYAGMYDLLDMNNHLISLLPDIGVSIRRYINRCEKAKQEEMNEQEEEYTNWNSEENSQDSPSEKVLNNSDPGDLTIPSFKEFLSQNVNDDALNEKENSTDYLTVATSGHSKTKHFDSYSKGIDALNRYCLKRVEEEQSLDELVKERIIKWINKRQAKYILIFSEVDKLLNQHKAGECYSKFHSYLLFNLGKLVTVCDSYHQKLKELLYSTTIRRKKKRKKVKILPEAMTDVFDEINDLKKSLEHGKVLIKKCNNELKAAQAAAAVVAANASTSSTATGQ